MQKKSYNLLIIIVVFAFAWSTFSSLTKAADYWALDFDGINDYVSIPHSDELAPTEDITIETWFKADIFSGYPTIIEKGAWQSPYPPYWYLYLYNESGYPDGIWFDYYDGSQGMSMGASNLITYGQWQQVVVTGQGTDWRIFVNGNEVDRVTGLSLVSVSNPVYIGSGDPSYIGAEDYYFDGIIDEVRIYSRALTSSEISEHYNGVFSSETGLVGLWHFDEGSGLVASDSSGNNNNGSISGAAWAEGVALGTIVLEEAAVTGIGTRNASPIVELDTHFEGIYRDKISISYSATDTDPDIGGLVLRPVDIFYSSDRDSHWHKIAKEQPREGNYIFDTTKVPDGTNYKIIVGALDGYSSSGHAYSENFAIDNTTPTFDVSIEPSPPVREKDTIELKIISSEELKTPPEVKIIHEGREAKTITVSGSQKEFSVVYDVGRGPGKAVISISGEDLAGNVGKIISSGESFLVERYGPPPPTLEQLVDNQIFGQPGISVIGTGQANTEIVLTLNKVTKFTVQPSIDGSFKVDDISLSSDNYGYNTLSIIAFNKKGEDSEEIVLNLKLNSAPEILSTSISPGETLSGEKEISWSASDANNDELVFFVEHSSDGGVSWDSIVSDFSTTSYKIDTTQLADGSNYFLRVTADDGTKKVSDTSGKFTIKNNLSHISLDISPNYFTNINTPVFTGKITGSEQSILSAEYSLDKGKTWQKANAVDGAFNSLIEKIEITIPEPLAEGKYTILIRATDILNRSVKISRSFNIDTIPPPIPVVELPLLNKDVEDAMDTNLELDGLQVVFQGKSESEARIELVLEDEIYKTTANEKGEFEIKDVTLRTHSPNKFSLSSSDLADNISQLTGVVVSNNLPQISVLNPQEWKFLIDIEEIAWQIQDLDNDPIISQVLYQEKDKEWIALAEDLTINIHKWDVSKFANGDYKIKIIANDGISEAEEIVNVFIDNIAPKVVLNVSEPELTTNIRPTFSGEALDDFSGIQEVEYSFNNIDWYKALIIRGYQTKMASFRFRHHLSLPDGDYKIVVRTIDLAGNVAYSKSQRLMFDSTAPHIGSNLILSGVLPIFPDETGAMRLFKDSTYKILFSVAREAKNVVLRVKETIFDISFNKATLLWESEFNFQEPGDYPVEITVEDNMGNTQTKEIAALKVVSPGIIYSKATNLPIKEAKATLFIFDQSTNSWLTWDGQAFNQENPQETDNTGEYGFLVPPGKYRLEVSKPGFKTVKSEELEIKNNYLINTDIYLAEKKGIFSEILDYFIKIFGL